LPRPPHVLIFASRTGVQPPAGVSPVHCRRLNPNTRSLIAAARCASRLSLWELVERYIQRWHRLRDALHAFADLIAQRRGCAGAEAAKGHIRAPIVIEALLVPALLKEAVGLGSPQEGRQRLQQSLTPDMRTSHRCNVDALPKVFCLHTPVSSFPRECDLPCIAAGQLSAAVVRKCRYLHCLNAICSSDHSCNAAPRRCFAHGARGGVTCSIRH
jgi:hypothetical protein